MLITRDLKRDWVMFFYYYFIMLEIFCYAAADRILHYYCIQQSQHSRQGVDADTCRYKLHSAVGQQKDWHFCIPRQRDFIAINFETFSTVGKLSYDHEIIGTTSSLCNNMCVKFQGQKI